MEFLCPAGRCRRIRRRCGGRASFPPGHRGSRLAPVGFVRILSGRRDPQIRGGVSFAPSELDCFLLLSHGLRRGLYSFAALRLVLSRGFSRTLALFVWALDLPLRFSVMRLALSFVARLGLRSGLLSLLRVRGRGR